MDGIFGIGPLELILIAVIALIVMGPERLPSVIREGARYLREIRKLGSDLTSQFSDELNMLDDLNPRGIINEVLDPITKATKPAPQAPAGQPQKPPAAKSSSAKANVPAAAGASGATANTTGSGANGDGGEHSSVPDQPVNSILPPAPAMTATPDDAPTAQPAAATAVDTHAAPPPEIPA